MVLSSASPLGVSRRCWLREDRAKSGTVCPSLPGIRYCCLPGQRVKQELESYGSMSFDVSLSGCPGATVYQVVRLKDVGGKTFSENLSITALLARPLTVSNEAAL